MRRRRHHDHQRRRAGQARRPVRGQGLRLVGGPQVPAALRLHRAVLPHDRAAGRGAAGTVAAPAGDREPAPAARRAAADATAGRAGHHAAGPGRGAEHSYWCVPDPGRRAGVGRDAGRLRRGCDRQRASRWAATGSASRSTCSRRCRSRSPLGNRTSRSGRPT